MNFKWNLDQFVKPVTYTITVNGDNFVFVSPGADPVDAVEKQLNTMPTYKDALEVINSVKKK